MTKKTGVLIGAMVIALLLLAIPSTSLRADNPSAGIFEMDGNAVDQSATGLPDDWDTLFDYAAGGSNLELVKVFIVDIATTSNPDFDDDIFTTGGAKDIQDVNEWRWTTGNVPDKDDISDAYAALYRRTSDGHLVFVFGLDRYANNGDAQLGFWLFQRPIYKVTPTSGDYAGQNIFSSRESDPSGSYLAYHTYGDILILGHFTQGGTSVSLEVYQWVGGTDPLLQLATGVNCTATGTGVDACVEVNSELSGPQTSPWYYHPKSGTDNVFPYGSFFEGNADLTQILPNVECFSSFMAETRSSQSLTAQLKDFALATRPTCSIAVTKSCPAYSKAGDTVTYTYSVENTGIGTLYLQSATDETNGTDGTVDLLTLAQSEGCGTLAPGATCTFTRDYVVDPSDPDTLTNTVTFVYNENASGTGIEVTDSDVCSVQILHPEITVTKVCRDYARVGDSVEYTITIENTGDADLVFDSASDTFNPSLTLPAECSSLAAGASCQLIYSRTVLETDPDPLVNTVTVNYKLASKYGEFANAISDTATCTTDIIHPALNVAKSCGAYARVGDDVHYSITVTNTGDVPLDKSSISDTLLGTLTDDAGCGATLAIGASCTINATRTVLETDPDPLPNTVTATYSLPSSYGISADYSANDSCSTDIIHPAISVTKSCDAYARVGDSVHYSITVSNTGDVPLDKFSVSDTLLGDLSGEAGCGATLAVGASCTINMTRTVLETDPDPLPNSATATYSLPGTYNITASYSDSDSCSTDIIHPALHVTKTCSEYAIVGGSVDYTITVTNDGDVPLTKTSIADSLLGTLTGEAGCGDTLTVGASCTITKSRTVLATDPDPLPNTVVVHYGLPAVYNITADYTSSDSCSTDIVHPAMHVTKVCSTYAIVGGSVNYVITVFNDGDIPLSKVSIGDNLLGDLTGAGDCGPELGVGQYCTITASRTVLETDPDPLPNTATATFAIPASYNVSAQYSDSASCSTDILHPAFEIHKSCLTDPVPVGASAYFRINLYNTGDVPMIAHLVDANLNIDQTFTLGVNPSPPCDVLVNDPDNGCFMVEDGMIATGTEVSNTASVEFTLDPSYGIDGTVASGSDEAVCAVTEGGATRTLGFWKTHWEYTCHIFDVHMGGSMNLGWKTLTSCDDVLGMLYANVAQNSDGSKRDNLCKARVQASHQAVAALLNSALSNGKALPLTPAEIADILSGNNRKAIMDLANLLDEYNNSGDYEALVDNDGTLVPHADPKTAKDMADLTAGDC